ncbi:MAG: amino acid--tRNA ligase-related protein, partial [Nanoarchaeota archaeon]
KKIAKEVFGTLKFETHGYKIDLGKKWELYDYEKTIQKYTKINIFSVNEKEIIKKLDELDIEYTKGVDKWRLVDSLWKYCRKKIAGPGFLIGQPVELSPLAKKDPKNPRKVEQFQVIIAGSEVGNGYSELNDPLDQEKRFEEQMKLKEAGDTEAQEHDKGFVDALKHGMPPTCGFGVSERLFSFLMGRPMRETVIFPLMKPEENDELKKLLEKKINKQKISREKDFKSMGET